MEDFSSVKVGDRLWARVNFYEGWSIVSQIKDHEEPYRLVVKYEIGNEDIFGSFTFEGEIFLPGPQCLFWGPPEIIAPPRPKKMKMVEVEVRPYRYNVGGDPYGLTSSQCLPPEAVWCGNPQRVKVEVA